MRPLVILGDSHLSALQRGFDLDPKMAAGRVVQFQPLGPGSAATSRFFSVAADGTSIRTHASGWNNLTLSADRFRGPDKQDAIVAVSLPLNTTRILRGPTWTRHVPWALRRDDTELALSDQAVDAVLHQDYRHALDFVLAIKAIGQRVMVIEAPRFFAHAPYLVSTRFDVCRAIDSRYRTQVRAELDAAGISIANQPAATIATDGVTRSEYRHETPEDFLHANAGYGRLAMAAALVLAQRMDR